MDEGADQNLPQADNTDLIRNFVIRRHPVGIILVYIETISALAVVAIFFILLSPEFLSHKSIGQFAWLSTFSIAIGGMVLVMLLIATYIYNQNRILVSDHDIVQIMQRGLLFRKISRLELSDVEDVAVDQKGILPTMFNYGTLTIETAGAEDNFVFPYCIGPNAYAHMVLQARARYIVAITGELKNKVVT